MAPTDVSRLLSGVAIALFLGAGGASAQDAAAPAVDPAAPVVSGGPASDTSAPSPQIAQSAEPAAQPVSAQEAIAAAVASEQAPVLPSDRVADLQPCVNNVTPYQTWLTAFAGGAQPFYEALQFQGGSFAIPTRNVTITQPSGLNGILGEVRTYGLESREGRQIAIGLGQAALVCAGTQPETAAAIQEGIAALQSPALELAFTGVTGNLDTASLRGLASPGGGGGGGGGASAVGPNVAGGGLDGTQGSPGSDNNLVAQTTPDFAFRGSNAVLATDRDRGSSNTTLVVIINTGGGPAGPDVPVVSPTAP